MFNAEKRTAKTGARLATHTHHTKLSDFKVRKLW